MTTVALEIHDAGLLAWTDGTSEASPSPGYALYENGSLLLGEEARRRAREKPRWTHSRFWQDLGSEPLGRPFPLDLSTADLAHAHLESLWRAHATPDANALLALPGSLSSEQLSLILGIAQSLAIPVAGLVDSAVATAAHAVAAASSAPAKILHLDIHLHRAVVSELILNTPPPGAPSPTATAVRRRVETVDGVGLVAIQDAWARCVAELFVQSTRFDPLHSARTEQALYGELPQWLDGLRHSEVLPIRLGHADREHGLELTRPDIVNAADPHYEQILHQILSMKLAGESVLLLICHHAAALPGLEPRLGELRGVETVCLPAEAAAAGALGHRDEIIATRGSDGALPFVTRVRFEMPSRDGFAGSTLLDDEADDLPEPTGTLPTHLLHGDLAYPITAEPLVLGVAIGETRGIDLQGPTAGISRRHLSISRRQGRVVVEDHSTYGSFLNELRIGRRAVVVAGDRLRLGTPGIEVRLIAEVDDGEA